MFKLKIIDLKYDYKYSDSPIKTYNLNKDELDSYLSKYNNSQAVVQLKASPLFRLGYKGVSE